MDSTSVATSSNSPRLMETNQQQQTVTLATLTSDKSNECCLRSSCGKVFKVVVLTLAAIAVTAAVLAIFGVIGGPILPLMLIGAAGAAILLGTAIQAMVNCCCPCNKKDDEADKSTQPPSSSPVDFVEDDKNKSSSTNSGQVVKDRDNDEKSVSMEYTQTANL